MGDLINLKTKRKKKAREEKRQRAIESRAQSGRSKSIKKLDELEDARRERLLEGARVADEDVDDDRGDGEDQSNES